MLLLFPCVAACAPLAVLPSDTTHQELTLQSCLWPPYWLTCRIETLQSYRQFRRFSTGLTSMCRSSFTRMRAWQANRNCRKRNCDTMPVSRTACRISLQVADNNWATSSPGLSPPAVHECCPETHPCVLNSISGFQSMAYATQTRDVSQSISPLYNGCKPVQHDGLSESMRLEILTEGLL